MSMKSENVSTLLPILGVVLTAASVIASFAQYRAANLQAEAAVIALMPQLEVISLLEKVGSDKFTDRRIEVTSEGGPIHNFHLDHMTWIEFRVGKKNVASESLNGYYSSEYASGRTRGALITIKGYRNNEVFSQFLDWARVALPDGIEIVQPITILRLSYRDALKQDNLKFVKIEGQRVTHVSNEEGEQLWSSAPHMTQKTRRLDINDLTSEEKVISWLKNWRPLLLKAVNSG